MTINHNKFSRPISLRLWGPDAVREYAIGRRHKDWHSMYSDWLVALIHEIAKTQFPYNSVVQREVEKRLGLPQFDDAGSTLSGLVYSCQCYAHEETKLKAGFRHIDDDFLAEAYNSGGRIVVLKEGLMGSSEKPYCVKRVGDRYIVRPPRARTNYLFLDGSHWAKIANR